MYYEKLFSALNKKKVKYAVVGGVAVNLYGIERATHDLDLLLAMDEENLLKTILVFKKLGYRPKVPVRPEDFANKQIREKWIKEKNMIVFSYIDFKNPYILIDIVISSFLKFEDAAKNINILTARDKKIKVPVVSIDDLIKMKKQAGRARDISDIEMLKKAKKVIAQK
jgi:Nucleotidyl transferase AbiEii toxin, Type IV TA system